MRLSEDGEWAFCSGETDGVPCESKIKNHRWGRTKAEGWFHSRQLDEIFCPLHIPAWVGEWRAKKEGAHARRGN